MSLRSRLQRVVTVALMAAVVLGTLAPHAEAKHRHRRYKVRGAERRVVVVERPVYRSVRVVRQAPYASYTVWRSERGPVIAGFLGGLFLGATLTNAAPHGFVYWDSYCHRGFASLGLYDAHLRRHAHEHVIQVVEAPNGYESVDIHSCRECGEDYWGDEHVCDE